MPPTFNSSLLLKFLSAIPTGGCLMVMRLAPAHDPPLPLHFFPSMLLRVQYSCSLPPVVPLYSFDRLPGSFPFLEFHIQYKMSAMTPRK